MSLNSANSVKTFRENSSDHDLVLSINGLKQANLVFTKVIYGTVVGFRRTKQIFWLIPESNTA